MDKRTIIAFILIAVVIIFWDDYLKWVGIAPEPGAVDSTVYVDDSIKMDQDATDKTTPREFTDKYYNNNESADPVTNNEPAAAGIDINKLETQLPERFINIETENFKARLTTHGAGLVSYKLKPTRVYLKKDIELLKKNSSPKPAFRFWTYDGPVDTDGLQYVVESNDNSDDLYYRLGSGQKKKLRFKTDLGDNRELSVVYTFRGDGYTFLYDVEVSGDDNPWVRETTEAYWKGGLAYTEPDSSQDVFYSKASVFYTADILEKLKQNAKKDQFEGPANGETKWASIRTKYFVTALIPETSMAVGNWMESKYDSTYIGKFHPNNLGVGLNIPILNGEPSTPVRVYIGPLDDALLSEVDPSLKQTMTWGIEMPVIKVIDPIIKPISKLILLGLKTIHKVIPNYGICVILFSILIKLIIWPLTRKSYRSMAAMQSLQPKIKELKEKYKEDPQKVQVETMNLYRKEKVNPMGGCLPVLLQMPLLYALFIVFRATIEFRRAPFVFWIQDLSLPDVIFHLPFTLPLYGNHVAILPIVMGITTYFQSKSTMTDPNQKAMLYMMPVFLTLIFNQFPSGLTLYYTLFNILTVLQQKYTKPAPAPEPAKPSLPKG